MSKMTAFQLVRSGLHRFGGESNLVSNFEVLQGNNSPIVTGCLVVKNAEALVLFAGSGI